MLYNDFYQIKELSKSDELVQASLQLNAEHAILKGHFPEMPVVPGVCMVQMLKEVTERAVERKLILKKAPVIKFLSIMQPAEHPEVKLEISIKKTEERTFAVNGKFNFEAITFFKFKGHFDEQV